MRANKLGRRDANEREILAAFESMGCPVVQTNHPVDLLVGIRGRLWAIEVKDGNKAPSDRKLTVAEQGFIEKFHGYPVAVVSSVDEAVSLVNEAVPR